MRNPAIAFMLLAAGLACAAADAQTIYRCGAMYSQTPCAGGKPVDTDDARSTGQIAEARELAAHEQRQADRMEHDRLRRESALKPALASGFDSRSGPIILQRTAAKPSKNKRHRLTHAAVADDSSTPVMAGSRGLAAAP